MKRIPRYYIDGKQMLIHNKNFKMPPEEQTDILVDAVAVLIGDYERYRKQAALMVVKALLPDWKGLINDIKKSKGESNSTTTIADNGDYFLTTGSCR